MVTFESLKFGALFTLNGNLCCKQSTRTCRIIKYGRTFYVRMNEMVKPYVPAT